MVWFASISRLLVRRVVVLTALAVTAFAAPATAQPALWVVKDADSTIYMLGTIHLLKPETQWRTDKLDAAIAESQELWLELPTTDPQRLMPEMIPLVRKYGISKSGALSSILATDEIATLDEAARLAGLTAIQLESFRPWYAALTISQAAIEHAGFDTASGVDSKIEAAFRSRGIEPQGLETLEEQINVFADMTPDQELRYLRETIEEYEDAPTELDQMVDQWSKADLQAMEQLFVTELKVEEPDLYHALLADRNANWVVRIEEKLKGSGVIFMAFGAAHLIGPDSVIALLNAHGIHAERVQ